MVKKAVFHLGNIDCVYSADDIQNYIRSLGITIFTCFELKRSDKQPLDNKAFRICIAASNKQKLCDSNSWSVGVSLKEWVHKPKDSTAAASATGNKVNTLEAHVEGASASADSMHVQCVS